MSELDRTSPVRARRLALGLTQKQVATRTGLTDRTVRRIECGDTAPAPASLILLAQALRCDARDLLEPEAGA